MTDTWLERLAAEEDARVVNVGATEEEIAAAEEELGIRFPPSYRQWLRAVNDTRIGGGEIFSLAPAAFADDADTDIRYRTRLGDGDVRYLVFYAPNDDESFAFDLAAPRDAAGEVPVARVDHLGAVDSAPATYADSFAAFIERLLDER